MFWPDPTYQPHTPTPPTQQTIHPPMGGEVFTDFKSLNGIKISWLVQVLLNFDWFRGSPPGEWRGGWMWVGGGKRVPPTHMHMHIHAHTHAHVCMHTHVWQSIGNSQGFPQWGSHLHEIIMFTMHACACVHVCACAHVWGHLPTTPTPIHPPPQKL